MPVSATTGRAVRLTLRYALLVVLAVIVLFPIYITIVNSLLRPDQVAARPPILFPKQAHWSTYRTAWDDAHLSIYLRNSFIVATLITVAQIVTAVLAAYAFAFLEFPFKRTLFVLFLATLMVPFEATIVTNRQTIVDLGWFNSYPALVVPFLATGFGAFLLRQAFLQVPTDLQDAAALDGYGHWRFLTRVVVPLARPAIGALAVFSFLLAWNQYLWPLIVTESDNLRTVQIGLRQLRASSLDRVNITFAGTILASLPIFVLLILFQKQLVRGLTAGAVKG
jgi:ABC-type glycerol-3-phosphate transport system permease component